MLGGVNSNIQTCQWSTYCAENVGEMWYSFLLPLMTPPLEFYWCDCYSFVYFINKSFWYNCSTSVGTTSRLVSRNVNATLKVWTPHQICSEPNGLWQRGLQCEPFCLYKQRMLSPQGSSRGLTGAIVKNVNCRFSFFESPSRRQTVPGTSNCACTPG